MCRNPCCQGRPLQQGRPLGTEVLPQIKILFLFLIPLFLASMLRASDEPVKILSVSRNSLVIEFSPDNWKVTSKKTGDNIYRLYSFGQCGYSSPAGAPMLPTYSVIIGLPPAGAISYTIVSSDYNSEDNVLLLPAPDEERRAFGVRPLYEPDPHYYQSQAWYPQEIIAIDPPEIFRSQRIAKIHFNPLQYSAADKKVRQYNKIVLRIDFAAAPSGGIRTTPFDRRDEPFYRALLLNYRQAKAWRLPAPQPLKKAYRKVFQGDNWYKIIIRGDGRGGKEGLYKLDVQTLSQAGVPTTSIDPRTIRIFNNGGRELPQDISAPRADSLIENPIEVIGEEDGSLDKGDYILFYGRSLTGIDFDAGNKRLRHYIHRFEENNVYWLTFGGKKGKRIRLRSSLPTDGLAPEKSFRDLAFVEEEKHNLFNSGVNWFGFALSGEKKSYSYTFSMPGAVSEDSANFRFRLVTESPGMHGFRFRANGNPIGQAEQRGGSAGRLTSYVAAEHHFAATGVLLDGANTISIEYLPTSKIAFAYVDWIEVEYSRTFTAVDDQLIFNAPWRNGPAHYRISGFSNSDITIYDVTDISDITKISNAVIENNSIRFADETFAGAPKRYVALTPGAYKKISAIEKSEPIIDLRKPRTADYIIITHDDFYQQAQQLESLREDWNAADRLQTEVVKISSVFNEFSWGLSDPTAIRDFLAYAAQNWGNPRYVLLFGDGHFDYKNILGYDTPNFIPPYETGDRTETASRTTDDWFVYTRGPANGMQMAIGRLPVQTIDQAQSVVDKIIAYETKRNAGAWRKTITVVADDELAQYGTEDEEEHTLQSEELCNHHTPGFFDLKKIYLIDYPVVRTASIAGRRKPLAQEAIIEQLNRGTLIINYIGHGNAELWAHEQVLTGSDVERIQNKDCLPLWVAATCEFAHWDQPQKQSLAERILALHDRGAIAMVASSRLAFSGNNALFNYELFDELFADYNRTGKTARIGQAVMMAKRKRGDPGNNEKYGVFGDPAMRLAAPRSFARIDTVRPDSIQALRKTTIIGHVEKQDDLWQDFDGKVFLRVQDAEKLKTYKTHLGTVIRYKMPGNSLFNGVTRVRSGRFDMKFIVPKDISYGGKGGRISLYFWNDETDGTGVKGGLPVGGTAVNLIDRAGPEIKCYFGDKKIANGDCVPSDALLTIEITDSLSGVNIAGDIGHQITLTLDGDEENKKDVTDFFRYDEGSYVKGSIKYPLYRLKDGRHTLTIKAWDNSNNSSVLEMEFTVVSGSELILSEVLTYPNPMTDETSFCYQISQDAEICIKIYSVSGRLLRQLPPVYCQVGYNIYPDKWDGTDEEGDKLANGVYLYKVIAKTLSGENKLTTEKINKLIITR